MRERYLHEQSDFEEIIEKLEMRLSIDFALIEKDYWIMHCLYGMQQIGMKFQMKGGTSLSKGFGLIERFSEDIDIRIEPSEDDVVYCGANHDKPAHRESRKLYYDKLCEKLKAIDGIVKIERDFDFDDVKYRNGGIRLDYPTVVDWTQMFDVKKGILLEVGFDDVTPNMPVTISSWVYEYAHGVDGVKDNRAIDVLCYDPGYTFVEKLHAISSKFRKQQASGKFASNFMRHYYDVYCLLGEDSILEFVKTDEYLRHKKKRFGRGDNLCIHENDAFIMEDPKVFRVYEEQYEAGHSLYYREKPSFGAIVNRLREHAELL